MTASYAAQANAPPRCGTRRRRMRSASKDYVESQHLVVPWKERKAFLRDEESEQRLREHNAHLCGTDDSPITTAVGEVLGSTGDQLMLLEGALICHPDAL